MLRRIALYPVIVVLLWSSLLVGSIGLTPSSATAQTTEELLEDIQHKAFLYFWNEANPTNGLIRDRSQPGSPASIAAVGFGLSAICIAIDHGWVSRVDGRARVLTTLNTFWTKPQGTAIGGIIGYKGLFYHFLDMNTGFRTWDSELSTIDTALLMAGMLDARQYFSTNDPLDLQVRDLADDLYERVDWEFMRNGQTRIMMGWKPNTGFGGFGVWQGYNEAMILYLLALGSPTFPVPASTWTAWCNTYSWQTHYGYTYVNFPPLFGHQYSHCWVDFRYHRDPYMQSKGITYFENSRRATLAQREYCIDNPFNRIGYGEDLWGLTASDDPFGYSAHGAPPPQNDNGTITPTAAVSSIPFTPTESIECMENMYFTYGGQLWGTYGFKDAFNLNNGWFATDFLGIDQGPIIMMIENHLNGSIWNRFMDNPAVQLGLQRAGFIVAADTSGDGPTLVWGDSRLLPNSPNPFRNESTISYRLPEAGPVRLILEDVTGRQVRQLFDGRVDAGVHALDITADGLASGVYYYRLQQPGRTERRACVVIR